MSEFCPNCQAMNDRYVALGDKLNVVLAELVEMRQSRDHHRERANQAAREGRENSPSRDVVKRVFARHNDARVQKARAEGAPRKPKPLTLSPDRHDWIVKALEHYDEQTTGDAGVGVVWEPPRFEGKVFDDIAYAFSEKLDGRRVVSGKRLEAMAEVGRGVPRRLLVEAVRPVVAEFGKDRVEPTYGEDGSVDGYLVPCPFDPVGLCLHMRIVDGVVRFGCLHRHDEAELVSAVAGLAGVGLAVAA